MGDPGQEAAHERGPSAASGGAASQVQAAPAGAVGQRLPDFFIIGHEKCGTTALYKILQQHPQIFMPKLKEPRFFVSEHRDAAATPTHAIRPRTLEGYLELFGEAAPDQLAGEASPQYIRSREAPGLIAQVQPAARLIAVLREPTSFLRTYHLHCVRGRVESERDLRKAIALEEQRRHGNKLPRGCRAPNRLFYCDHVRYVEQLRRFEAVFGREQIMVVIYEDFRRDNDAAAREVLRFLDVDDTVALDVVPAADIDSPHRGRRGRKAVRLKHLHRLALAVRRARRHPERAGRVSRTVEALTPGWLRSDAAENLARRTIFSVPAPPDEQLTLELRARFKPEVVALSEYLGRDLVSEWGYEGID
jgi:Sulfotransferase family